MKALIVSITALALYHIVVFMPVIKKSIEHGRQNASLAYYIFQRLTGFVVLGVIPFWYLKFFSGNTYVNAINYLSLSLVITGLLCLLIIFINNHHTYISENSVNHPQIKLEWWNDKMILINSFTWILYLTGYEWLLRGVFFSACLPFVTVPIAIAINLMLYALMHIGDRQQFWASIPFGLVLCLLTLFSHSVVPAILIHCTLAISFELFCILKKQVSKQNLLL